LFLNINRLFIGIDSSGFKTTNASQYYTYKAKIPKKYVKLSVSTDVLLFQLICTIKIRRAPTRHDTKDFPPLVIKASEILPISVTVADKGYDSENNHVLVRREYLHALSIIPSPRYTYLLDTKAFHYGEHMADTGRGR
jgi:Transposase DDE domain